MRTRFKNRIVGSGEEQLDQIMFNPRNWRVLLAKVEAGDREVLWTYKRLREKTRVVWQRE